jgi:hypothetical protein
MMGAPHTHVTWEQYPHFSNVATVLTGSEGDTVVWANSAWAGEQVSSQSYFDGGRQPAFDGRGLC